MLIFGNESFRTTDESITKRYLSQGNFLTLCAPKMISVNFIFVTLSQSEKGIITQHKYR